MNEILSVIAVSMITGAMCAQIGYWLPRFLARFLHNKENTILYTRPEYMRAHIQRNWSREEIDRFAKHLLGDICQACDKR